MSIIFESRIYKLTGISPVLGSQPADPEIRKTYIEDKIRQAGDRIDRTDEAENLDPTQEQIDKKSTIFGCRAEDGALILWDYQIKGTLKAAIDVLQKQMGVVQGNSKFTKFLHVSPRNIPFRDGNGELITQPEPKMLERSLRAMTMQGPRVALASSQKIELPWSVTFRLSLLANDSTPKSKAITWDIVETCLDYGQFSGLGQWHNGGWGKFRWERMPDDTDVGDGMELDLGAVV